MTFVRQSANLWAVKDQFWRYMLRHIRFDPAISLVDSFPVPVCRFARAYRCRRFKGEAAFGKDILVRQTFYGFRVHMRLCWPGVITRFVLAPANVHELSAVPELVAGTAGLVVGDRNYWAPSLAEELRQSRIELRAPFRWATRDPWPRRSALLSRIRYRIDTVFSQLVERYQAKRVWARDTWHLHSRLLRKILSHTFAFILAQVHGDAPLRLANLLP